MHNELSKYFVCLSFTLSLKSIKTHAVVARKIAGKQMQRFSCTEQNKNFITVSSISWADLI